MPNGSLRGKLGSSFLVAFGSIILAWVGWLTWSDMTTLGKDIGLIFFGSRTNEALGLGIGMKVVYYFLIGLALFLLGFLLRRLGKAPKLFSAKQISRLRKLQKEKELEQPQKEKELEPLQEIGQLQKEKEEKEKKVEPPVKSPEKEEGISGCLHHFGYLASRPKNAPIPEECLVCPRLGDCMVTTVYIDKQKEGEI